MKGLAAFKKWFGASKVRDAQGGPLQVYHGTTHDFASFVIERGNIENFWGAGFYFTTDAEDAGRNYAGEGPDLTNRLESLSEQFFDDLDRELNPEGTPEGAKLARAKALELARQRLKGSHDGAILPVYLKISKPLVLGGAGRGFGPVYDLPETYWSPEQSAKFGGYVLEETQAFGLSPEAFEGDFMDFIYGDDRRAEDVIKTAKEDPAIMYAEDESGALASSEILANAIRRMGYDGIIDRMVMERFRNMGLNYETVHFIVWNPAQVKSVFNRGTWNPKDPVISNGTGKARATRCGGRLVRYGAKGAKVMPGTSKGDAYCARSLGQMRDHPQAAADPCSPLRLSRKRWACKGAVSVKGNPAGLRAMVLARIKAEKAMT